MYLMAWDSHWVHLSILVGVGCLLVPPVAGLIQRKKGLRVGYLLIMLAFIVTEAVFLVHNGALLVRDQLQEERTAAETKVMVDYHNAQEAFSQRMPMK